MYLLTSSTTKIVQNKKLYILVQIIKNTTTSGHLITLSKPAIGPRFDSQAQLNFESSGCKKKLRSNYKHGI